MTDSNIFKLNKPDQSDPLQEVLREGARKMLAAAIETEVSDFIKQHGSLKTDEGELAVVRNGYLPARPIQIRSELVHLILYTPDLMEWSAPLPKRPQKGHDVNVI